MLDQIIKNLDPDVVNELSNIGIPQEKTSEVMGLAQSELQNQFKQKAESGDMSDLLNLFNGNQAIGQSSLVDGMIGNFADTVANKIGVSPHVAKTAAAALVPMVLSKLNDSTPSTGLTQDNLTQILGGGEAGGLGGMIGKFKNLLG
jgi:dihydroxyacid dehydratase/phosphogluconate dehydratase